MDPTRLPYVVLMVDDDEEDYDFLSLDLHPHFPNLILQIAKDGQEVQDYLNLHQPSSSQEKHPRPDLILVNPFLFTFQVMGAIEKMRTAFPSVPVVLMVNSHSDIDYLITRQVVADEFLIKPIKVQDIAGWLTSGGRDPRFRDAT